MIYTTQCHTSINDAREVIALSVGCTEHGPTTVGVPGHYRHTQCGLPASLSDNDSGEGTHSPQSVPLWRIRNHFPAINSDPLTVGVDIFRIKIFQYHDLYSIIND